MYCGICVEVCPFDALFWSPEFEYAEYEIDLMTHEKERLQEWTYKVLPPPALRSAPSRAPRTPPARSERGGMSAQECAFAAWPWSADLRRSGS